MVRISNRQISDSYDYHGAFFFTTYYFLYDSFIRSCFLLFFFCHQASHSFRGMSFFVLPVILI